MLLFLLTAPLILILSIIIPQTPSAPTPIITTQLPPWMILSVSHFTHNHLMLQHCILPYQMHRYYLPPLVCRIHACNKNRIIMITNHCNHAQATCLYLITEPTTTLHHHHLEIVRMIARRQYLICIMTYPALMIPFLVHLCGYRATIIILPILTRRIVVVVVPWMHMRITSVQLLPPSLFTPHYQTCSPPHRASPKHARCDSAWETTKIGHKYR